MNATLDRKLRFSDVVYAIGTTPKSLRLWLQRGLVQINTSTTAGSGWASYSFQDIAILALIRELANFGVSVPQASEIANMILGDLFFPSFGAAENSAETPVGVLSATWANRRVYLYRDGDDWKIKNVALWESHLWSRKAFAEQFPDRAVDPTDAEFDAGSPSGMAKIRREHEPASAFISIDVKAILENAFERAIESVTEGADEDVDTQ